MTDDIVEFTISNDDPPLLYAIDEDGEPIPISKVNPDWLNDELVPITVLCIAERIGPHTVFVRVDIDLAEDEVYFYDKVGRGVGLALEDASEEGDTRDSSIP